MFFVYFSDRLHCKGCPSLTAIYTNLNWQNVKWLILAWSLKTLYQNRECFSETARIYRAHLGRNLESSVKFVKNFMKKFEQSASVEGNRQSVCNRGAW